MLCIKYDHFEVLWQFGVLDHLMDISYDPEATVTAHQPQKGYKAISQFEIHHSNARIIVMKSLQCLVFL